MRTSSSDKIDGTSMTAEEPMGGEGSLTLDHVALVTPDLNTSKEDYERLGFRLTRESAHRGKLTPEGPVEPWGSGNRCAMFRQGYFEILGVVDEKLPHDRFRALANRFHGVGIVALGCERADELFRSRKDRVQGLKPPVEIGRDVPIGIEGDQTKPGLFRVVRAEQEVFPEAELFFIEHATPDVLWQKSLLDHPNGVQALSGITLCSEYPEETADRFERLTLRPREEGREGKLRFALDEGIASVDEVVARFKDVVLPAVPCVAVVTLTVSDVDETRRYLKDNAVTPHLADAGVWVRPERAGGVVLYFVPVSGN
jgi:catechol 2,3-dioxygenase-like lactoylglutathione lyase family enzyme